MKTAALILCLLMASVEATPQRLGILRTYRRPHAALASEAAGVGSGAIGSTFIIQ